MVSRTLSLGHLIGPHDAVDSMWDLCSLLTGVPEAIHRRFLADLSVGPLVIVVLQPGAQGGHADR